MRGRLGSGCARCGGCRSPSGCCDGHAASDARDDSAPRGAPHVNAPMGVYGVGAAYAGEGCGVGAALVRMIDSNVSSGRVTGGSLARGSLASAGAAASVPTAGRDSDGSCCTYGSPPVGTAAATAGQHTSGTSMPSPSASTSGACLPRAGGPMPLATAPPSPMASMTALGVPLTDGALGSANLVSSCSSPATAMPGGGSGTIEDGIRRLCARAREGSGCGSGSGGGGGGGSNRCEGAGGGE